jgi:tRNA pseudouridine55 synthase
MAAVPPLGILLLDKPIGLSSNAALQRVRRLAGGVKAGHAGSLDPLASGMLAVCLGEATRLAGELLAGRKAYEFVLKLGERTATGDAEGDVIERAPVPQLTATAVEAALVHFRGPQQQVPPMYAALKRAGEPLYRLARRGIAVPRAPRALIIDELELLRLEADRLELRVLCSKGTYVRVLGEDLARALGSCGHLTALRRLYLEPFVNEPMIDLTALETRPMSAWPLLPPERALLHRPALRLHAAALRALAHGRVVPLDLPVVEASAPAAAQAAPSPAAAVRYRLYDEQGRFCGLGALDEQGGLKAWWLLRALRQA